MGTPLNSIRRRRKLTMAERRVEVGQMYITGQSQQDIAKALGCSQPTVSRDLEAIHQVWLSKAVEYYNVAMSQELAKIDNLERTYWEQFEASKGPETTTFENVQGSIDEKTNMPAARSGGLTTRRKPTGAKGWLEGVQWCIEKRIKMLGLNEPEQIKVSWHEYLPDEIRDDKEELQRQFAMMLMEAAKKKIGAINDA